MTCFVSVFLAAGDGWYLSNLGIPLGSKTEPPSKSLATLSLVKFEDLDPRRLRNTPVLYTIEAIPLSVFPLAGVLIPGQNLLRRCLNK